MQWAPDGSFFLAPGGEIKEKDETVYCAYAFARNNISVPALAFPLDEPVIITHFSPNLFELKEGEFSLFKMNHKLVFALMTSSIVAIYTSTSLTPLYYLKNIHYASLTDISFYSSLKCVVSSMDGFLTFIEMDPSVVGHIIES